MTIASSLRVSPFEEIESAMIDRLAKEAEMRANIRPAPRKRPAPAIARWTRPATFWSGEYTPQLQ